MDNFRPIFPAGLAWNHLIKPEANINFNGEYFRIDRVPIHLHMVYQYYNLIQEQAPKDMDIVYLDGNKMNPMPDNLYWRLK